MTTRRASLLAFAKINLDLRVLYRRSDNYHELRTVFQTISLADRIDVAFTASRQTNIQLTGNMEIQDNLMARAAELAMGAMRTTGHVEFKLRKRIPMGAGLGGGSSDAAAVLLCLPVLAGRVLEMSTLLTLAEELGSDVPFFLMGGAAVGLGRGSELYPLPDGAARAGIVVAPNVHVSTAEAYRRLSAQLTSESQQNKIVSFESNAWKKHAGLSRGGDAGTGENDFERVVFDQHPRLESIKRRLLKLGARPALMSGSGSAIFGLFSRRDNIQSGIQSFREESVFPIRLVSRDKYRSEWWKRLRLHTKEKLWPPQSRYAR
jgi:4-diphosphocytidyl-2-C-methyl-D-erythritol kinase